MLIFNKIKITAWHVYILTFWLICILLYQLRSTFDWSYSKPTTNASSEPARQISATELLSRPLTKDLTTIPRILHQCYFHPSDKPDTLPPDMEKWSAGCRKKHSDWEWVLWDGDDNLKLVQKYYPWLEESYLALPKEIFRADMARTLYMYTFGGVYMDLDTDCLQPTEALYEKYVPQSTTMQTALLGRMGDIPEFENSIPNAWMASTPAHPFFLVLPNTIDERVRDKTANFEIVERLTGPVALRESLVEYETRKIVNGDNLGEVYDKMAQKVPFTHKQKLENQVIKLPSEMIYPYSWGADGVNFRDMCWVKTKTYNADACKKALEVTRKGSVSITYWSHSW